MRVKANVQVQHNGLKLIHPTAREVHRPALDPSSNQWMFRTEHTHTRKDFRSAGLTEAAHEPASQSDILDKKVMRLEETRTVSDLLEEEEENGVDASPEGDENRQGKVASACI